MMKYRLGLDLGSTSLGWAAVKLNDDGRIIGLLDLGVRISPDGRDAKTHTPINVERRNARTMRRRCDRVKLRIQKVLGLLKKYGLEFQLNKKNEDPYKLRAKAITDELSKSDLGRVLFHLALRRGFKSNRKDLKKEGGGKLKSATESLNKILNNRTLGTAQAAGDVVKRFSNQFDGDKIKDGALYPTRQMYIDEFNTICDAQNITGDMRDEFYNAIFYQRPLRPQDVGFCVFESGQPRAYKFDPVFQKWRTLQQINQLKIMINGCAQDLSPEQTNQIRNIALGSFLGVKRGKITFSEIKKQLGLSRTTRFNLESDKRTEIDADKTAFEFYNIDELDFWHSLTYVQQSDLLHKLNDDRIEDEEVLKFLHDEYGLDNERANKIVNQISLEDGTASVSVLAMNKMMPWLEKGDLYHLAEKKAYNHSDFDIPQKDFLPYYGDLDLLKPHLICQNDQYKTTNATVHIALNQVRALVNELISKWGKPAQINLEFGRDLRSGAKERSELDRRQTAAKKKNDEIREILEGLGIKNPSREDLQKYKLWESLADNPVDRRCVYSGEQISINELFFGNKFEIEHILPFAQTLDDTMSNKTISAVAANRFKGNRTPYDAFNDPASPWKYEDVLGRAENLPTNVKWRFNKDALETYLRDNDCIARALNDTKHMSRLAALYLKHICLDKNSVHAFPGQMTALFRDMWALNWWKNKENADMYREHHIHHAIDAFVIACMDSGKLQKLSSAADQIEADTYYGKNQKEKRLELFADIKLPFDGFDYYQFREKCENTFISYRPSLKNPKSRMTVGQLHEDTAYSLSKWTNGTKAFFCISQEVAGLKENDLSSINRTTWTQFVSAKNITNEETGLLNKFITWCNDCGIKKVRVLSEKDSANMIPVFRSRTDRDKCRHAYIDWYKSNGISAGISDKKEKALQKQKEADFLMLYRDAASQAYKWFIGGNNFCADIFAIRIDEKRYPKLAGKWQVEIITNYDVALDKGEPMWRKKYQTARRIMQLRVNDIVRAEFSRNDKNIPKGIQAAVNHKCQWENKDTVELNFRVKKLSSNGQIFLRPDWITKEKASEKSWGASAGSLQAHKARKVFISPAGVMKDPGFLE